jgi:hypothetical protein
MKSLNYFKYILIYIILNVRILSINAQTNLCNDNDCGDDNNDEWRTEE